MRKLEFVKQILEEILHPIEKNELVFVPLATTRVRPK